VGFDNVVPGFFWCAGQGGYGIQTAPALSLLASKLILGGELDDIEAELAESLSPRRLGSGSHRA
jgi:D-arginine dehydrogenase